MPTVKAPSYSSERMDKVTRANRIEYTRLATALDLLEKAKIRQIRVANREMRLVAKTLDTITACSGHSPEGLGPNQGRAVSQDRLDENPIFMYGQRIISRRALRLRRPKSASIYMQRSIEDMNALARSTTMRPQTSPVSKQRRPSSVSSFASSRDSADTIDDDSPIEAWAVEQSFVTKKLLRAQSGRERKMFLHDRQHYRKRSKSDVGFDALARAVTTRRTLDIANPNDDNRTFIAITRSANTTDVLHQAYKTLSANAYKYLGHHWAPPKTVASQRQYVLKKKLTDSKESDVIIQNKVAQFIKINPRKISCLDAR